MGKASKIIPTKYSVKWLYWFIGLSLLFVSGLYAALDPSKTLGWHSQDWVGILVLGIGSAFLCNLLGFFNLRIGFLFALLGVLAGIVVFSSYVGAMEGFGDLAGLMSFIMLTILGALIGLAAELIVYWTLKIEN
jgi:hypothetical protein